MKNKRFLVILRAGDCSLHHEWLQPAGSKNFDLCLSYYGDEPERYKGDCDYYDAGKGPKFQKIHELIKAWGDSLFKYDAVWFPDDDISTNAHNIQRMFHRFMEYGLSLAQPALTKNAYSQVTSQHIDYKLRYTHYVEPMVPIFSKEALRLCWPTFNKSLTGRGLEIVWAKILGYPHKKMGIIDETPVKHMRPPGSGDLYDNIRSQYGENAGEHHEMKILDEYGLKAPKPGSLSFYDGIKQWDPFMNPMDHATRQRKKVKRTVNLKRRKIMKPDRAKR